MAGTGDGIQPLSTLALAYASAPTRTRPAFSPTASSASLTALACSHGPMNSYPSWPAMLCRSARKLIDAIAPRAVLRFGEPYLTDRDRSGNRSRPSNRGRSGNGNRPSNRGRSSNRGPAGNRWSSGDLA